MILLQVLKLIERQHEILQQLNEISVDLMLEYKKIHSTLTEEIEKLSQEQDNAELNESGPQFVTIDNISVSGSAYSEPENLPDGEHDINSNIPSQKRKFTSDGSSIENYNFYEVALKKAKLDGADEEEGDPPCYSEREESDISEFEESENEYDDNLTTGLQVDGPLKVSGTIAAYFKCRICGIVFKDDMELIDHIVKHAKEDENYKCIVCLTNFKSINTLRTHLLIHYGRKPFKCQLCGCQFRTKFYLNMHLMRHGFGTPELWYTCDYCGLKHDRILYLKRHLETHKDLHLQRFSCKVSNCGLSFSKKRDLHKHIKVHKRKEKEKPKCNNCGLIFLTYNFLIQHQAKVHGVKANTKMSIKKDNNLPICYVCKLTLKNNKLLKRHLNKAHKIENMPSEA